MKDNRQRINYADVVELGFNIQRGSDKVYFDEYGFEYEIITKNLSKRIYIDWDKVDGKAKLVSLAKDKYSIISERPVNNLIHLKEVIDFFEGDDIRVDNFDEFKD